MGDTQRTESECAEEKCKKKKRTKEHSQQQARANCRQEKNKEIFKPKAEGEHEAHRGSTLPAQDKRGIHQEYIEHDNRKFSYRQKVSEHNHHRNHEACKNEMWEKEVRSHEQQQSGDQALSKGRQYRKSRTGEIAQVHRGREAQS